MDTELLTKLPQPIAPAATADTAALPGESVVLRQALSDQHLWCAWERVRDNQGCAGADGQSLQAFGGEVLHQLQVLKAEVLSSRYAPRPLKRVEIPKRQGGTRTLAIPTVRDRVLQCAVALVLNPLLDAAFDDASFGYRPGRSVQQALARVIDGRDQSLQTVVDADIESFFDQIDHGLLLAQLSTHLNDTALSNLISLWLSAVLHTPGEPACLLTRGVPQGSPLSPLLANLYLDPFDQCLRQAGLRLVRYADDFVVMCTSVAQAQHALGQVRESLSALKLRLNADKTRVTTFAAGFIFLGVRFHHNLVEPVEPTAGPWLVPDTHADLYKQAHQRTEADGGDQAPDGGGSGQRTGVAARGPSEEGASAVLHTLDTAMDADDERIPAQDSGVKLAPTPAALLQSLYVSQPGCWLTLEHDRVVVSRKHAVLASVPLGQLDQMAVMDNAMVSTALLRRCAERGVSVALGGRGPELLTLDRGRWADQQLLRAQWQAQDDAAIQLMLARRLVAGKLHNSRVLLRRFGRRDDSPDKQAQLLAHQHAITHLENRLEVANDLSTVRGLEGAAARRYFDGMRILLPEGTHFPARQKHPPRDPFNLCLSLGYAVLANNLHTLIRLEGLNPHLGHLHRAAPGSVALVSDLMEEFRAPVADAVVLTLWRQGTLSEADVEWQAPGSDPPCRLQASARRTFIDALEHKLQSQMLHPVWKKSMDLRRAMQAQVRHYIRVLLRVDRVYRPFLLR
jgi:CRISPR-associated protein Cas1